MIHIWCIWWQGTNFSQQEDCIPDRLTDIVLHKCSVNFGLRALKSPDFLELDRERETSEWWQIYVSMHFVHTSLTQHVSLNSQKLHERQVWMKGQQEKDSIQVPTKGHWSKRKPFRNSLRWSIHTINLAEKTKLCLFKRTLRFLKVDLTRRRARW